MKRRSLVKGMAGMVGAAAMPAIALSQTVVRYPDPRVEVLDPRFDSIRHFQGSIKRLYTGTQFAEGPVWFGDGGFLLWSDIPNNRIMRWLAESGEVSEFRRPSNYTNGNTRDLQGRLVSCERRRITRTELDGSITVLINQFKGKPLNSPNDAVYHPDGSLWFTDPGYGIASLQTGGVEQPELPTSIYRFEPDTGKIDLMSSALVMPNGIAFSPDFSRLYVADTGPEMAGCIFVFDVVKERRISNPQVFAKMTPGFADGIRVDAAGNLWSSAGWVGDGYDGVHIFAPDGTLIGRINLPEVCANLCFGGPKGNQLFMCASQSLYALEVEMTGAQLV